MSAASGNFTLWVRLSLFRCSGYPAQARACESSWLSTVASGRWRLPPLPSRLPSEMPADLPLLRRGVIIVVNMPSRSVGPARAQIMRSPRSRLPVLCGVRWASLGVADQTANETRACRPQVSAMAGGMAVTWHSRCHP